MSTPHIRYVSRDQLHHDKWNALVTTASNGLIYAQTHYLDAMCHQWSALVMNDYEAVMPLTWRSKMGISYLYQPMFVAQLGIIAPAITPALTELFLAAIPSCFQFIDIDLHETNMPDTLATHGYIRKNMLLWLNKDYTQIQNGYHRLANRMLSKASTAQLQLKTTDPIAQSIAWYQQTYNKRLILKEKDMKAVEKMMQIAENKNQLLHLTAYKNNELVAVYLLLQDDKNVYSVMGGSNDTGKQAGAFYFLTDAVIHMCCNTNRVFRFEGSDKKEIAFFNQQFGAMPVPYLHFRRNRLPIWLRWLKPS